MELLRELWNRLTQIVVSVVVALAISFEATSIYFGIALLVIVIDVISAYMLGRRVSKKYPDRADGKFKSEYKFRILFTFIVFMLALMAGFQVDVYVLKTGIQAQSFAVWVFIIYECWSVGENWSSENDSIMARVMQRVMVNKADRHFNLELKKAIEEVKQELKEEEKGNDEK